MKVSETTELPKKLEELRTQNQEQAQKKWAEREEEQKKEYERALKKARKKALDNQRMLKKEELTDLYARMADKRREYSRYLNESSLQREGDFAEDAKRPRSINVRAVKSYEKSFLLDVRQQMNM